jgi:hypothetical protein
MRNRQCEPSLRCHAISWQEHHICRNVAEGYPTNKQHVHEVMPQKLKGNISPYEHKTKRKLDRDTLFIRVFSCPTQYEPWGGALHKRASKTEWGYFVGMQWPMVLIMRPEDWKVISVSRKKVLCHEERYATSDSVSMQNSIADSTRLKADLEALKGEKEGL